MVTFRNAVNVDKNTFENMTVTLINDIDLSSMNWSDPIGYKGSSDQYFAGTFDGSNYTINLYINTSDAYRGLFGQCKNATIKNLTVTGEVNGADISPIVARVEGDCYFENVTNKANVTCVSPVFKAGSTDVKQSKAGGIVCMVYGNATFKNCYNYGNIDNQAGDTSLWAGGIAAMNFCDTSKHPLGSTVLMEGCYNYGNISTKVDGTNDNNGAGGIMGYSASGLGGCVTLNACHNEGIITGKYAGSMVGKGATADNCKTTIKNCSNTGNVTSHEYSNTIGVEGNYLTISSTASSNFTVENWKNTGSYLSEDDGVKLINTSAETTISDNAETVFVSSTGIGTITSGVSKSIINYGTLTINSSETINADILNYGKLTIVNGTFNGTIISKTDTLTINGGTFNGNISSYATATITDGNFNCHILNKADMTISGGTFEYTNLTATDTHVHLLDSSGTSDENKATLTITGGTFTMHADNSRYGYLFFIGGYSTTTISDCTINSTSKNGNQCLCGYANGDAPTTKWTITISNVTANGRLSVYGDYFTMTINGDDTKTQVSSLNN